MGSQTIESAPAPVRARARWRRSTVVLDGGHELAVFEAGRSDSPAPAIVFVHGLGHWTQAAWDVLGAPFEATHRLVAFDLPGFGDSAKPDAPYPLAFFTAALREVIRRTGVHRFTLVGHSLGGLIAADYAARYPGDVRLLALIDPAGFLRTPKVVLLVAGSRPVTWLFRKIRPSRKFVRRTLNAAVFDTASVAEDYHERAYALSQDAAMTRAFASVYAGAMRELMQLTKLHRHLATYAGPALIVWGRQDRFVPIRALANARLVYPQAEVLVIDRCGHCPNVEYPELLAARLRGAIGATP